MKDLKVAILMGSDSDLDVMREAAKALEQFEIKYEMHVISAHRTPELVSRYAATASENGFGVLICGAGSAAHLAGVVAAHTSLPVIGVPIDSSPLNGFDSLLSTVQMPVGIPVATVAVGKSGAWNAGILAAQILATGNGSLKVKLEAFKKDMAEKVLENDQKLQAQLASK